MKPLVLMVLVLVTVAYCQPQYVEWFETKSTEKAVTYFDLESEWENFKKTYNKNYELGVEKARKTIFKDNLDYIIQHNEKYNAGEKSYHLGVNQFADMTTEELRMYNGLKASQNKTRNYRCSNGTFSYLTLPDSVDWRTKGYVSPVKNQGDCGSSWAFSATGSLEGQHFNRTGKRTPLSVQQLVDCSGKFGNDGCNNGLMDNAFAYIKDAGGIESEYSYPYTATENKCTFLKSKVVATCAGCVDVRRYDEEDLQKAVADVGPISVAIDASHLSFHLYKGGVYDEPSCSQTELHHAVLVVGYGTSGGKDYWLVKNSWGTTWGDEGYAFMSRNKNNQCGIASWASYPIV